MIFNADFYSQPAVAHDSYFQTTDIDLTSLESVAIKFQQYMIYCCDENPSFKLLVSDDDFETSTEYDVSPSGIKANSFSSDPDFVDINITPAAAGKIVKLRFQWTENSHYFWMIDDIAITTAWDHDLVLKDVYPNFYYTNGGYFSNFPVNQVLGCSFYSEVFNKGANEQTNVQFNVDINLDEADFYDAAIEGTSIVSLGPIDTIRFGEDEESFYMTEIGTYNGNFSITQDSIDDNPGNNLYNIDFNVTENIFARDYTQTTTIDPSIYTGAIDGEEFGITIYVAEDDTINSIQVYIGDETTPGVTLVGHILDDSENVVFETKEYEIVPEDIVEDGKWIELLFDEGGPEDQIIAGGETEAANYIVSVQTFYNGIGEVHIGGDESPFHYFNIESRSKIGTSWGYIDAVPMVRLRMYRTLIDGISENILPNLNIYPNPTNGILNIENTENSEVIVYNMLGSVVASANNDFNNKTIDISNLSEGTYIVKVIADKGVVSRKISLVK